MPNGASTIAANPGTKATSDSQITLVQTSGALVTTTAVNQGVL